MRFFFVALRKVALLGTSLVLPLPSFLAEGNRPPTPPVVSTQTFQISEGWTFGQVL